MTRHHLPKFLILFFCVFISIQVLAAEEILDNDFNFSLDIPEGYEIDSYSDDGMSYSFTHPNIPVTLILKISESKEGSAGTALASTMKKINAKNSIDSFAWKDKEAAIGQFTMNIDQAYKGWALCAPVQFPDYYITLLCYAPEEKEAGCEQFIFSTLNSLSIGDDFKLYPGPVLCYAFPSEGKKSINLSIGGKAVRTTIDNCDAEASQFLIDLEYSVLTLYGKHKMWKEAWQRYYRMIYRDSYSRLLQASEDIYKSLYTSDLNYAQTLLTWTQNFDYSRANDLRSSDFNSLPAILCGGGSDCDSRSMLICVLLNSIGIESRLYFSPEFSHALAAAKIKAPGQTFKDSSTGAEYLIGETTAKVTWGKILQEQADRSKWIEVSFN